jgi:hypothetical protein
MQANNSHPAFHLSLDELGRFQALQGPPHRLLAGLHLHGQAGVSGSAEAPIPSEETEAQPQLQVDRL